jgi:flap endonuclease-1
MGCKLGPILTAHVEEFSTLKGKKVAVDGTNLIFKYLTKIRAGDQVLSDSKGRPISHLLGVFYFVINMLERHVAPIIVFDGLPLKEKRETPPWKIERLVRLWKKHLYAVQHGDVEARRRLFHDLQFSFEFIMVETIELLKVLGVPACRAPADAEAQCARLVQERKAYATLSHDYDSLLFGSSYMIYDVDFKDNSYKFYSLKEALMTHHLTRPQLIDVALLVGTDFNPGVKGIGPKKGLKAIQRYQDLETFRRSESPRV